MIYVGLDVETGRIAPGRLTPPLVCMTLAVATEEADAIRGHLHVPGDVLTGEMGDFTWFLLDADATATTMPHLLADSRLSFIVHNAAFDGRVTSACAGTLAAWFEAIEARRIRCTEVREKLMHLANGELRFRTSALTGKFGPTRTNLAECVARYFGEDISDVKTDPMAWRLRYEELRGVPLKLWPDAAVSYAAGDAVWHLRVFTAQDAVHPLKIDGLKTRDPGMPGWFLSELREVKAAFALGLGAAWGVRTDAEQVVATLAAWRDRSKAGKALGREHGFVRTALYKRGPKKGLPTKRDGTVDTKVLGAMIERAYAALGMEAPKTPTGKTRTAESVLRDSGDPVLEEYAKSLSATNWLGKYGPILIQGTMIPITYRVDYLKSTGRTSVSKPPLQQPPREGGFRECFVPRPGYLYAQADYDQVELRTLAQMHILWGLGDTMAQAFRDGQDPHLLMAVDILNAEGHETPEGFTNWSYSLAVECRKGRHSPEWKAVIKAYRQMAKAANFGLPGGLGPDAFVAYAKAAYGVTITHAKAVELKALWLRRWPEMIGYFRIINGHLAYGDSYTAQQAMSGRLRGGCHYTDGANTYFQGLAADGFKAAAYRIQRECYTVPDSPLYGSRMVLPLHDEFIVEAPEDRAAEAAERLAEVMVEEMQEHTPDVPITTAPALMRRWYKDAEEVRDASGRLVPWEPTRTGA